MNKDKLSNNRKIVGVFFLLLTVILFLVFSFRFVQIMATETVNGKNLQELAYLQYSNQNKIAAKRGEIFDRNGESIAVSSTSYKLIAILTDEWSHDSSEPKHVTDKEKTAKRLSKHIAMSEEDILKQLQQDGVKQAEFGSAGNNLSYETKKKIEEENIAGIVFEEQPSRLYPNGVFASHIVGLAQKDSEDHNSQLEGVLGLEAYFQDRLSGQDGSVNYQQDILGYVIPGQDIGLNEASDGQDIYLTIDKSLQMYLESVVSEVNEENPSVAITASLMDAKNGDILAATQRETFNATTKENIDATWQNYHVEYTFEPGSTFKVITLAAAINEGVFNPDDYFQSGQYEIGGGLISDVKPEGWGYISYLEGLARSSNTAFVQLFEQMGADQWKDYLDQFGIGQKTGISLPNENTGTNPYSSLLQQANTSFGQGLTVTPMQMLQAFSVISNQGRMLQPQLVEKIVDSESGEEQRVEAKEKGQVISEKAANETLANLKAASNHPESTSKVHQIEGYDIAIKTGTSEIVDPETGRYMTGANDHIFSVVGYAPADNPQYIFYVTVQQPELSQANPYGGQVASNIFKPIMKRVLDQMGQGELTQASDVKADKMKHYSGKNINQVQEELAQQPQTVLQIGSGQEIVQQYPQAGSNLSTHDVIILMTNGSMSVPDMTGLSKNEVLKISEMTGVAIDIEGSGYVVEQNLPASSPLKSETSLSVQLAEMDEGLSNEHKQTAQDGQAKESKRVE